jgi:hypothetical protein
MPGTLVDGYRRFGGTQRTTINIVIVKSKVKLSHYTPWRHMGGEEVVIDCMNLIFIW